MLADFQICISVPLRLQTKLKNLDLVIASGDKIKDKGMQIEKLLINDC